MPTVDHVIVLMMENRSFDFMLGYMRPFPQSALALSGRESNPQGNPASGNTPRITVTSGGMPGLRVSPDHSHRGVLHQMLGRPVRQDDGAAPDCSGFVNDYEDFCTREKGIPHQGPLIMKCLDPYYVPVLSTLAKSFGVCLRWHCSVPGETWPNRNFAHAATSDGEVNITFRMYGMPTIFRALGRAGHRWTIFHDGMPQAWCLTEVLNHEGHGGSEKIEDLRRRIADDTLPAYSFVEPKHFGSDTNSQHPGNNTKDERDFYNGELLIARIYQALRDNPHVFEKTLFIVTYDEHGGHWDHVPPPRGGEWEVPEKHPDFRFDLLGPRVPTVVISPRIDAGTFDDTNVYEHSSIVKTLRENFIPSTAPFNRREETAASALPLLSSGSRGIDSMPDLSEVIHRLEEKVEALPPEDSRMGAALDDFQKSLVKLARAIDAPLRPRGNRAFFRVEAIGAEQVTIDPIPISELDREVEAIVAEVRAGF